MPKSKWWETKTAPRKWKFKYLRWAKGKLKPRKRRIIATQYAIKRNKDNYDLIMKGKRY